MLVRVLGVLFCLSILVPSANAEVQQRQELRKFSLTISPFHLFLPVVELTGEVRVKKKLGIAPILGGGYVKVGDWENGFSVFEAGVQTSYYVIGDFDHGMQLGVEVLYAYVSTSQEEVKGIGSGVAIGPFVGYKIITDGGFTFFIQGGYEIMAMQAEAHSDSGDKSESKGSKSGLLLNINLGWSF